jgi:alkylation response protein AidB-like acyl-CoA dehydrogenase
MKIEGVDFIDPAIKGRITTKNIYTIFNQFVYPFLTSDERTFLEELEQYLLTEVQPELNLNKDVYELFPLLGKGNYLQRLNQYKGMKYFGMRYELLLSMAISIMDPELDLARVVNGLIFTNPIFQHGKSEELKKILDEVLAGEKIGCICITERNQGSDAVNMKTLVQEFDDKIVVSGEKIFTTNGPVADYFIVYGVADVDNPRKTMYQAVVERNFEGLETHRFDIQAVPRVHIGQTIFKDVAVPKTHILGGAGKGYENLFSGLVAERDTIIGSSIGLSWLSLISTLIYTNHREQFKQKLFNFQGVSFPLTELFIELMAATSLAFTTGTEYRKFVEHAKYKFIKYNAAFSSGTKSLCAQLAHKITYEAQLLCGGVGYTDNLRIDKAMEVGRIQEIIGGPRNIQTYLVTHIIKDMMNLLD